MNNTTIIIDFTKCTLCKKCIKVCVSDSIKFDGAQITQSSPHKCIMCGHCAAICPEDAIESQSDLKRSFKINSHNNINQVAELLTKKRSIREFQNREIDKETVDEILKFAEKAPSSSNKRVREYIAITDIEFIKQLESSVVDSFKKLKFIINLPFIRFINIFSKKSAMKIKIIFDEIQKMESGISTNKQVVFRNAPLIVFVIAPKNKIQAKDDCIISQQYMMIFAESIGIGSCIIGYAQAMHKAIERKLKIKKGYSIYAVSIFGYPKYKYINSIDYINQPQVTYY